MCRETSPDPRLFAALERDYEYIYHFAAVIGVRNVLEKPDRVLYVNAVSTLNLFDYAKSLGDLRKVLFSSTSEIYAGTQLHYGIRVPTPEDLPLCVADIASERTTYALSKMYGESIAFTYGKKYGIPFTVVRYHNIYGPRMGFRHVIPEMFKKISDRDVVDVSSPSHTRAFCYIDDAVEATIRCCVSRNTEEMVLNIGNSQEEISIRDLVRKIAAILGREIRINELPDTPGSPVRRCPDVSKLERLTGFRATCSLEEGIRKAYEFYRHRMAKPYE